MKREGLLAGVVWLAKELSLSATGPDELGAGPVIANRLAGTDRNPPARTLSLTFAAGAASEGFPDGTNARRAQVSLRLVF